MKRGDKGSGRKEVQCMVRREKQQMLRVGRVSSGDDLQLENRDSYLKPGQHCRVDPISAGQAAGASSPDGGGAGACGPQQGWEGQDWAVPVSGLDLPGGLRRVSVPNHPLLLFVGSEPVILLKTLPKRGGEKQSGKANIF